MLQHVIPTGLLVIAASIAGTTAASDTALLPLTGIITSTQSDDAATAFEPVRVRFRNLLTSLQAAQDVGDAERDAIADMLNQVMIYRDTHPNYVPAIAMQIQILRWMDGSPVDLDAAYEDLVAVADDAQEIRFNWAQSVKRDNRYARAIAIIEAGEFDYNMYPNAATLMSECLYAEHRFEEAVAVMDLLDDGTLADNPLVRGEVTRLRPVRAEAVSLWAQEQDIRRREAEADDLPRAEIITAKGRIEIELFENEAPNTVANFITLSEESFYNGTTFHRVIANFMSQGGDPNTRTGEGKPGEGNPGYNIIDEHTNPDVYRRHFSGSVAMAKTTPPHTAGSQFYITHRPTDHLNGKHTVFGRVIEGLDVARSLDPDEPIISVRILRKQDHEYEVRELPIRPIAPPSSESPTGTGAGSSTGDDTTGGTTAGDGG